MALVPLILLLLLLPLAVAGQNIGTGVVALLLFWKMGLRWSSLPPRLVSIYLQFKVPWFTAGLMLAVLVVATALNPTASDESIFHFLGGYQIWWLLPPVILLAYDYLLPGEWERLFKVLAFVAVIIGVVALSQLVWGWRLEKTSFVAGELRARGFYSHPLTFAYVYLLPFPLGVAAVLRCPRNIYSWMLFLGISCALFASQSRAVQLVAIAIMLAQITSMLKGRTRNWVFTITMAALGVVAVTKNPVSERFQQTFAGNFDVQSGYLDDRLAFWDVHWHMFQERPLLGHGMNTGTAYRIPYYEALGLGAMQKKYEAHNMYLQMLVDGGIVALGIFAAWLCWFVRDAWRQRHSHWSMNAVFWAWTALLIAALVQNAFQDSEVRYALTLLTAIQCLSPWRSQISSRMPKKQLNFQ